MPIFTSACLDAQAALSRLSPYTELRAQIHVAEQAPTVLVVDDDPDIAPLVDRALRPFDIRTVAVTEGKEALTRLTRKKYDLVVLDLAMGDVHGFELLRRLRELPLSKDVPVLILTANGSHEALARSFGQGANEFVKKPFDVRELGLRAFRLIRPFA